MDLSVRVQRLPIYTAAITTIVVIPSFMDPINLPKLWILCLGAGLCLAILSSQITSLLRGTRKAIVFVSILFLLALLMSSIASPQGIFKTLVGVWGRNNGSLTYLALLIIFISLTSINSADPSKYLVHSLMFLGFFGALYGWMQSVGTDPISWANPGNKIVLTLGNPNFASAFLALTAIATLSVFLRPKVQWWKRAALGLSFAMQIYLTNNSDSIQGLLVLIIGSAILIGLTLTFSNRSKLRKFAIAWWVMLSTGGALGISGLFGSGPLSSLLNPNLRSLQDRYYHWVAALNMIKENPVFGVGIDSFGDYYRIYRTIEGVNFRDSAMTGTNNAHNTFMQIGATGGLVLLLAYLVLVFFTGHRAVIAFQKSNDKILVSGVFSIWIAFQVQSLVSIDQIGLVVWGWAAAGCLVALSYLDAGANSTKKSSRTSLKVKPPKRVERYAIFSLLTIVGLLPSILLLPTIQNELTLRKRIVDLVSSTSEDSLRLNAQELYLEASNSQQPELRLQALDYLLQVKSSGIGLKLAVTTANQFPESFASWDALASIYEGQGQKEKAIAARKVTIKLDPLNDEIKKLLDSDKASS
jgi:O-antigen ligase